MSTANNVNPTPEEVAEWGYDAELYFIEQDEDLILYSFEYIPTLLQLASDNRCPKQQDAFWILCQFSRESALKRHIRAFADARRAAALSTAPLVREWCDYVDRLLAYEEAKPVNRQTALAIAQDLLLGPGRVGVVSQTERVLPGWLEFVLSTSFTEYLYIELATGRFLYSRNYPRDSSEMRPPWELCG